jgi:hypothetical protein
MNSDTETPLNNLKEVAELLTKLGAQNPASFHIQKEGLNVIINLNGPICLAKEGVDELARLINSNRQQQPEQSQPAEAPIPVVPQQDQRLAYSAKEAAKLIGVSHATIYRLIVRGLLHCTPCLRTKLIRSLLTMLIAVPTCAAISSFRTLHNPGRLKVEAVKGSKFVSGYTHFIRVAIPLW